ncbi:motility associated factor glycosyltransferase family protein [Lysinibacillus fusiformis]|uniref:6-hydroxymethylpterin diphosphokinase MptE-like domain-containing protein n=1 Tax=Lysinibacillus fusiformis TaxID=28031 RepID=A0A1H9LZI9_9BACI|nr:6-hydroxymethylpterin diphosphokinase MptE-like protein [Lysinibacillus fusiformis]SCY58216.1 Protein of unknown function DUF115 [Lysinibacillus fusiformis]SEO16285.1 Protein of unknown function DUF115 [Lysinibacillus fusiformis]SER16831.1 Protein of unknown function DUF115 [Lysinibacillus fusiformis]
MGWIVEKAKDNQLTLKVNNVYIYSKYKPLEDVKRLINTLPESDFYVVLGLGLGYHLLALKERYPNAHIYGISIDKEDKNVFDKHGLIEVKNNKEISIVNQLNQIEFDYIREENLVIPMQWTKALGEDHALTPFIEDIKLRQMSRDSYQDYLDKNFEFSSMLNDMQVTSLKNKFDSKVACLVSSGPSLDHTIEQLKECKNKAFILAVSSCLKILEANNIKPDAIIISDAKPWVKNHFNGTSCTAPLFYLATASKEAVENYSGKRIKLFQKGYTPSEKEALHTNAPLFDVGGSVATLGFSLLNYLGFSKIILFGQDLGFTNEKTHASNAGSGVKLSQPFKYKQILANDGSYINISKSLYTYWRWFDKHVPLSKAKVYNTALKGSKISEAEYITEDKLIDMLIEARYEDFNKLLEKQGEIK